MLSTTDFVIAYTDGGDSNKGYAIIGTSLTDFIPRTMWF